MLRLFFHSQLQLGLAQAVVSSWRSSFRRAGNAGPPEMKSFNIAGACRQESPTPDSWRVPRRVRYGWRIDYATVVIISYCDHTCRLREISFFK